MTCVHASGGCAIDWPTQYRRYVRVAAAAALVLLAVDDTPAGRAVALEAAVNVDDDVVAAAEDDAAALSKYLSNAAFALPGGPNGVFFSFSPPPDRSLLAERAR